MYQLRFISQVLYNLKRRYGQKITIVRPTAQTVDPTTGATTETSTSIIVRLAIVLPQKMKRDFDYDLSYVAANKNFTYGGFFDVGDRYIIVDRKDLVKDYQPSLDHRVIIGSDIYEVVTFEKFELDAGYIFALKTLTGANQVTP